MRTGLLAIIAFQPVYWLTLANPHHCKHTILFAVLAIVALVGVSFSRPVPGMA